jgi:dCMP deaminase
MDKRHLEFMATAEFLAKNFSKDPSSRIGAIFVDDETNTILATGYNGLPRKLNETDERLGDRENRLKWTVHAETNGILNAARCGAKLEGSRVYINKLIPCLDCAKNLVQAGIKHVYLQKSALEIERWAKGYPDIKNLFDECGVEHTFIETPEIQV